MTFQICLDEVCKFRAGLKLHLQWVETFVYLFMLRNFFGVLKGCFINICYAVLSGTKYGLKQTRGKFGLGAKMVLFLLLRKICGFASFIASVCKPNTLIIAVVDSTQNQTLLEYIELFHVFLLRIFFLE